MQIRDAVQADFDQITAIYNEVLTNSTAIYNDHPSTVEERISWWRSRIAQDFPVLVHARPGWTRPYLLEVDGAAAGYGSILVGGRWTGTRTVFEFFVASNYRARVFDLFGRLLAASEATAMEVQSNDVLLTVMLHIWARNIVSEKIIFEDKLTTNWHSEGARLHRRDRPDQDWVIELDGVVAANGGILYHYNRPYLWRHLHGSWRAIPALWPRVLPRAGVEEDLLRAGEYSVCPLQS